uniref:Uncharacterized protein n=1 Tax=Arundo donax TaxID=35708 RepID=A0A0A8Y4F6_ARUDO
MVHVRVLALNKRCTRPHVPSPSTLSMPSRRSNGTAVAAVRQRVFPGVTYQRLSVFDPWRARGSADGGKEAAPEATAQVICDPYVGYDLGYTEIKPILIK